MKNFIFTILALSSFYSFSQNKNSDSSTTPKLAAQGVFNNKIEESGESTVILEKKSLQPKLLLNDVIVITGNKNKVNVQNNKETPKAELKTHSKSIITKEDNNK